MNDNWRQINDHPTVTGGTLLGAFVGRPRCMIRVIKLSIVYYDGDSYGDYFHFNRSTLFRAAPSGLSHPGLRKYETLSE